MNDIITKVTTWIKANVLLAALIGLAVIVVFFWRQTKRLLFGTRRVRHRRVLISGVNRPRAGRRRARFLPRSVGMHKIRRTNKAAYNKNGSRKKPWQIAGSPAARRHMAQIRARR